MVSDGILTYPEVFQGIYRYPMVSSEDFPRYPEVLRVSGDISRYPKVSRVTPIYFRFIQKYPEISGGIQSYPEINKITDVVAFRSWLYSAAS